MPEAEPKSIEFRIPTEPVPWIYMNAVSQTRKIVRAEPLDELARAIESPDELGEPRNELLHPPLLNRLTTREKAEEYLTELNECFGTEHSVDELLPDDKGHYLIVIAGHRRRLATGKLIEEQGADPRTSRVDCTVRDDLPFFDALQLQIAENSHQQLSMTEQARAINAIYHYGIAKEKYASIEDCARDLHFGDEKVSRALAFCRLPDYVQDCVERGVYSYSASIEMEPLTEAYRLLFDKKYPDRSEDERDAFVLEKVIQASAIVARNKWGGPSVSVFVKNTIADLHLVDQGKKPPEVEQLRLVAEDYVEKERRLTRRIYRGIALDSLNGMQKFVDLALFHRLSPEEQDQILDGLANIYQALGGFTIDTAVEGPEKAEEPSLFVVA